jgi:hypothetical protein
MNLSLNSSHKVPGCCDGQRPRYKYLILPQSVFYVFASKRTAFKNAKKRITSSIKKIVQIEKPVPMSRKYWEVGCKIQIEE